MKHILSILLFIFLSTALSAQVLIMNDNVYQERMCEIKATVVDSLTSEPVPFASVYVIPSKDTTITNFTLSDTKGEAKLDEVPFGSYVFHVEMMGYKPFVKERYFRDSQVSMGTIRTSCSSRRPPSRMWAIPSSSKRIRSSSTPPPSGSGPMPC